MHILFFSITVFAFLAGRTLSLPVPVARQAQSQPQHLECVSRDEDGKIQLECQPITKSAQQQMMMPGFPFPQQELQEEGEGDQDADSEQDADMWQRQGPAQFGQQQQYYPWFYPPYFNVPGMVFPMHPRMYEQSQRAKKPQDRKKDIVIEKKKPQEDKESKEAPEARSAPQNPEEDIVVTIRDEEGQAPPAEVSVVKEDEAGERKLLEPSGTPEGGAVTYELSPDEKKMEIKVTPESDESSAETRGKSSEEESGEKKSDDEQKEKKAEEQQPEEKKSEGEPQQRSGAQSEGQQEPSEKSDQEKSEKKPEERKEGEERPSEESRAKEEGESRPTERAAEETPQERKSDQAQPFDVSVKVGEDERQIPSGEEESPAQVRFAEGTQGKEVEVNVAVPQTQDRVEVHFEEPQAREYPETVRVNIEGPEGQEIPENVQIFVHEAGEPEQRQQLTDAERVQINLGDQVNVERQSPGPEQRSGEGPKTYEIRFRPEKAEEPEQRADGAGKGEGQAAPTTTTKKPTTTPRSTEVAEPEPFQPARRPDQKKGMFMAPYYYFYSPNYYSTGSWPTFYNNFGTPYGPTGDYEAQSRSKSSRGALGY